MHPVVEEVTQKIIERSRVVRTLYLKHIDKAAEQGPHRSTLACGNLAHGFAACNTGDKAGKFLPGTRFLFIANTTGHGA
jgi:phosphogluconate dehydratase